jgi:DNA-binding transcriptional LysR family regulator
MVSRQLNLQALKCFHEIMTAGSGAAAAKRMGLSGSGVSRLISSLERSVGFELFYRGKGLVPTPDALIFFKEVNLAFLNIERVNAVAQDIRNHDIGQLKIVSSPGFSESVLVDVAVSFLKTYPKVRLQIDSRSIEQARFQVATRAADCGFAKLPFDRPDIRVDKIVTSDTVCVLSKKHPLAKEPFLTPNHLKSEPIVQWGTGSINRSEVEAAFKKAKVEPIVNVEVHTVGLACAFTARGQGISIVNELMAKAYLHGDLISRPFRPKIEHEFVFITSAYLPMSRLTQAFLDETKRYIRA